MYKVKINDNKSYEVTMQNGQLKVDGRDIDLDVAQIDNHHYHILYKNKSYRVKIIKRKGKHIDFEINGNKYSTVSADKLDLLLEKLGMSILGEGVLEDLKAPMPGLVLDIMVDDGDDIEKGASLVVLEAMKMENVLKAPADGTVLKVHIKKGQAVEKNHLLISFKS